MRKIFVLLFLTISSQIYSITKCDSSYFSTLTKEGNWINVSGSVILENSPIVGAYRIEGTYWLKMSKKSNIGIKLGYYNRDELNRSHNYEDNLRTKDVFMGLAYRMNFLTSEKTPFIGIDCLFDYNTGYNHDTYLKHFDNDWDWGSSYLINIGYAHRTPGSHWGFEICYSAGILYYNNFFKTDRDLNSIIENKYFDLIGINFLKVGVNYHF